MRSVFDDEYGEWSRAESAKDDRSAHIAKDVTSMTGQDISDVQELLERARSPEPRRVTTGLPLPSPESTNITVVAIPPLPRKARPGLVAAAILTLLVGAGALMASQLGEGPKVTTPMPKEPAPKVAELQVRTSPSPSVGSMGRASSHARVWFEGAVAWVATQAQNVPRKKAAEPVRRTVAASAAPGPERGTKVAVESRSRPKVVTVETALEPDDADAPEDSGNAIEPTVLTGVVDNGAIDPFEP